MITKTLAERLRELETRLEFIGMNVDGPSMSMLADCIAQAERETQAGELRGDFPPIPSMQEVIDNCEAPSQATGQQTPVAEVEAIRKILGWPGSIVEGVEFLHEKYSKQCGTLQQAIKDLGITGHGGEPVADVIVEYAKGLSPEARDRAILALDAARLVLLMNANSNEFYERRAQVRPFVDQALSALRGS
jgi:hypothetical protein